MLYLDTGSIHCFCSERHASSTPKLLHGGLKKVDRLNLTCQHRRSEPVDIGDPTRTVEVRAADPRKSFESLAWPGVPTYFFRGDSGNFFTIVPAGRLLNCQNPRMRDWWAVGLASVFPATQLLEIKVRTT